MPKDIIVSAANSNYFGWLQNLLASIERCGDAAKDLDIGILDCGLTADQRAALSPQIIIISPPWDYDIGSLDREPPPFLKSLIARPHLPRHFPGYEIYLWIDADCWIQRWSAVELYLTSARRSGFAITPAWDRGYGSVNTRGMTSSEWNLSCFLHCGVSKDVAQRWAPYPLLNAGVFAGLADAPHWGRWSRLLEQLINSKRDIQFYYEQTALNIAIREQELPIALLPATCNWLCHRGTPMCTDDGIELTEPNPPFEPLGIVHLSGDNKEGKRQLFDPNGTSYVRSLRLLP